MSKGTGIITQEHNGKVFEYPIVVLAENVKTDSTHQFVTQEEKESITQTIEKVGKYPVFGDAAKCGVANNDTTAADGYLADARIVKTHGDEIDNITQEVNGVKRAFQDGCNTLVSACTTYGATPESNSPAHIAAAIAKIYNNRYSAGYNQGIEDATPVIERKDFDLSGPNTEGSTASTSYAIQSTGTAYIALHMFTRENYDCATGVSNPGFTVKIGDTVVFSEYPWAERAAQDGDIKAITCFVNAEVTAGQVLQINYNGGYLCDTHLGGSVIIVS